MSTLPGGTPSRISSDYQSRHAKASQSSRAQASCPVSEPGSADSNKSLSPDLISKYLVQYVPVASKSGKQAANRVTGSRVLTSAEGLAILKEKEDKKKKEAEEKEKRRQEKEDRKKEKEALVKKKAEERVKKAEEKKKAQAERALASAQRKRKPRTASSRSTDETSTAESSTSLAGTSEAGTSDVFASCQPSYQGQGSSRQPSCQSSSDIENPAVGGAINSSECCECSLTYAEDVRLGTGAEWVECACGRWLHEECIDSIEYNSNGKEKFCSFCII